MDYFIIGERCATIRMLARDSLAGHWKTGFVVMLIAHLFLISLPDVLDHMFVFAGVFISAAIMIVISGPISLGIAIFSLAVARGQNPHVSQIFYGFERLGKATGAFWLVVLKVLLWSLIAVPFLLIAIGAITTGNYVLAGFMIILIIPACIPAIIAAYRYMQVFYILADNPEIGVFDCVERSATIMNGNKFKHFILTLSFIGWAILAGIPGGVFIGIMAMGGEQPTLFSVLMVSLVPWIAMFFVEAYVWTSLAVLYDMIVGNLRPGVVQTTAEVLVQSGQQESTQMRGGAFSTEHEQMATGAQFEGTQTSFQGQQTPEFKEERAPQDAEFADDNVRQKEQES